MDTIKYGCPKCKESDQIFEANTVLVDYHVTKFDGEGEPESYGDSNIIWDTVDAVDRHRMPRYRCGNCQEEFQEPVLLADVKAAL